MNLKNKIASLIIITFLSSSLGVLESVPASAANQLSPISTSTTSTSPMYVVGFDASVAAANGYEIRTDSQGRQYSVKIGSTAKVSPYDTGIINGNCGTSYITFTSIGNNKANFQTGFGVFLGAAVYYGWYVSITNPFGSTAYSWGGGLFFRSTWESPVTTYYTPYFGYTIAAVSTSSYATLSNGAICYSGGPQASDYIY